VFRIARVMTRARDATPTRVMHAVERRARTRRDDARDASRSARARVARAARGARARTSHARADIARRARRVVACASTCVTSRTRAPRMRAPLVADVFNSGRWRLMPIPVVDPGQRCSCGLP